VGIFPWAVILPSPVVSGAHRLWAGVHAEYAL